VNLTPYPYNKKDDQAKPRGNDYMMRKNTILVVGMIVIILGGYLVAMNIDRDKSEVIEGQNIKQLVHDFSVGINKAKSASITSRQLIVTHSDESQVIYDLLEEDFFVSIAPYVEQTHPCADHSLTGCRGEMANEEFNVFIEDTEGNVIVDRVMKSQANGFIDVWLPRDHTYRVTIESAGRAQVSEISTFESDNTCITTMQLMNKINA
jgi:hypothetical protein